jgi:hypothetical protein
MNATSTFAGKLYASFTFDATTCPDNVKTALASTEIVTASNLAINYQLGQIANPVASWNSAMTGLKNNAALQADLAIIKAEYKKQLQAYIDAL